MTADAVAPSYYIIWLVAFEIKVIKKLNGFPKIYHKAYKAIETRQ